MAYLTRLLVAEAFDTRLPPTQKFVLLAISFLANDTGQLTTPISELMDATGLSERAVQAAIRDLEESGFLRLIRREGKPTTFEVR